PRAPDCFTVAQAQHVLIGYGTLRERQNDAIVSVWVSTITRRRNGVRRGGRGEPTQGSGEDCDSSKENKLRFPSLSTFSLPFCDRQCRTRFPTSGCKAV